MTDAVVHPVPAAVRAALRARRLVAPLERLLRHVLVADASRRTLDDLPDNVLKDIGLTRSDGPADDGTIAHGDRDVPVNRLRLDRAPVVRFLPRLLFGIALAVTAVSATSAMSSRAIFAQNALICGAASS